MANHIFIRDRANDSQRSKTLKRNAKIKKFEVLANGNSYGYYSAVDKEGALIAHVMDAGYKSIADAAERVEQCETDFRSTFKIEEEIKVKKIRLALWDDSKTPAIYFSVLINGEEIPTLEWLDSDGDLESRDSHIKSAHNFDHQTDVIIREKLEAYLSKHQQDVADLMSEIEEKDEEEEPKDVA